MLARADDPTAGVFVRDSAVATEKFALADRMQRLGEWGKAADIYQDVLHSQADRVIAVADHPNQYQSVIAAVQDRLCHWPADGLQVYRDRFGPQAAVLLQRALAENRPDGADDLAQLHFIFANYFVTDAAKTAGTRLMDLAIEAGEFSSAAWIGRELLDKNPMLGDDRPAVLFRVGLAHHLAGDDTAAQDELGELQQKFPNAIAKIAGSDTRLSDALAAMMARPLQAATTVASEQWPMPFGSADRSRLSSSAGFGGARIFSAQLDNALPRGINIPAAARPELKQTGERDREAGLTLGVVPAIDRDELFFQDNVHVYALSLESGLPLQGWMETYPGDRNGRYTINGGGWPMPRSVQESVCLTDDSVLAVMGEPDTEAANYSGEFMRDTQLVCLDRQTGRERWVLTPDRLPGEPAALRQLDFGGSPLVVGQNVYILARGGRGMQFEDSYVLCMDLQTGKYKWSSYLASANNTAQMWEMEAAAMTGQNFSHIAFSGGRLFVSTNTGAVASVDAYSGSVIWLNMYPRSDDTQPDRAPGNPWRNAMGGGPDTGQKPWTYNPVIVREGHVFALPTDGTSLEVYDAGSGAEIKRVGIQQRVSPDDQNETANVLVGIGGDHGEQAVLASDRSVFCIDWTEYDATQPQSALQWGDTFAHGEGVWPADSIRGRPFLTADSVFVPLAWDLKRLSLSKGATMAAFPASDEWDPKTDGPGNVLVTQDHLIIAGMDHLNVYTDIAMATRKLDAAVAAAPNDPDQRLRYAEVLAAAERFDTPDGAIAKLDEAAGLMHISAPLVAPTTVPSGSLGGDAVPAARARLFNDELAFAASLQRGTSNDSAAATIDSLYSRAASAAQTASQCVTYRLREASYLESRNDVPGQLSLYQQILLDPQMRAVTVGSGENAASPAATVARLAVARLIEQGGDSVYSMYESQAQAAVVAAEAQSDPARMQQLAEVAEGYPNSHAAAAAMLEAAGDYLAAGRPREAAGLMRLFCSRYPDSPDRPHAIELLARAYLQMPNRVDGLTVAIGRLRQGATLAPAAKLSAALQLPDGTQIQNVTFAQAADALQAFAAKIATSALPDPQIPPYVRPTGGKHFRPLPEDASAAISNVTQLIAPLQNWARHDRIVTFSERGLEVYAVGGTVPLFTSPEVREAPRNAAWIGDNLLIWSQSQLTLLRGAAGGKPPSTMPAGALAWSVPLGALPAAQFASVEAGAGSDDASKGDQDANNPAAIAGNVNRSVIINGQRIIIRGNGQVFVGRGGRLQIIGGPVIIQPQPNIGPAGMIGRVPAQRPNAAGGNSPELIDHVVPTSDRVIFSTVGSSGGDSGSRVVCLSTDDGRVLWQTSLEDHQIDAVSANDDFVVFRAINDMDMRLMVFDASTGQPVWRPKPFSRDNNDVQCPINFCLAGDGSLVYLTSDHICCKDLFNPDAKLRFDNDVPSGRVVANGNVMNAGMPSITFAGATAPDQLVVSEDRVLALSDNGTIVRVYSLANGKAMLPESLSTQITNSPWNEHLRVVGSRLYVFGPNKVVHYGLSDPSDFWPGDAQQANDGPTHTSVSIRDVVVTRQDVLLLMEPLLQQQQGDGVQGIQAAATTVFLRPYSRQPLPNGHESGLAEIKDRRIDDASGINTIQVVDGGIYYATGDHKVHFLRGGAAGTLVP
jgi:outer membrane protein assembly factor BamB